MRAEICRGVQRSIDIIDRQIGAVWHGGGADLSLWKVRDHSHKNLLCHRVHHSIVLPPLTLMTCPVTNEASLEAR